MIFGAFLATLNQTVMGVAMPELMNDFNISAATAQWLTTGYMLVNGVLIPITAFLMQRFTTRQLFQTSMFIFLTGTIVAAIAASFPVLLTGRLIQATGAGIIMPLLINVILTLFPPEKEVLPWARSDWPSFLPLRSDLLWPDMFWNITVGKPCSME